MADDLAQAAQVVATKAEDTPASANNNDNESKVEPEVEVQKTIEQLLEDGAHALAMGKFAESCEHYAFAVEKLVEKHGEMAIETVDALEAYGNALLKNGIASSAVLGGDATKEKAAVPDASATATTSVPAAAPASASSSKSADPPTAQSINFHFGGDGPDDEEEEAEGEGEENGEDGDENEAAEEADDFETAWEVLDTARAILSKQETKERKLQLARVHSSMAEVATEAGRPEDGVKEYETALSIQSSLLEPYDRLVAQTHLFIALALELVPTNAFDSNQEEGKNAEEAYTKAIQHVEEAKQVLKNREHFLKGIKVDSKGKGKEGVASEEPTAAGWSSEKQLSEKEQEEIKDIEELQVELDNKVEDLKAQIVEAQNKKGSLQDQLYEAKPSLPENVSKEVHNLNNLVKKKPKKQDAGAATNGHASKEETVTNGKRKAEEEVSKENGEDEKKVKVSS